MTHPAIIRARETLARGKAQQAAYEAWHATIDWNATENEHLRMQREAEQEAALAEAKAERDLQAEREQWHADVASWQQARQSQPHCGRVIFKDWGFEAEERSAADDEDRTLFEVMADVLADETTRALRQQKYDLQNEIEVLRSRIEQLEKANRHD